MKGLFAVAALIISSPILAQEDTSSKTLDGVIVTATKTPIKQAQTGKVVSVIDQATIQRNIGKTLTEILNHQTGVFINGANNAPGTNQDFYFRGAGTGNVLILMDGIPVMDPSQINNSFDLNSIAPSQIERIEILKGAQSTLWGSDAVAGVVNIITKRGGAKKISPSALASYGSYNTFRSNASINGTISGFDYNLNYSHTNTKGFSAAHDTLGNRNFDNDGLKQNNFQGNIGYRISPKVALRGLAQVSRYKADLDAAAFADDADFTGNNSQNLYSVALDYNSPKFNLHFISSYQQSKRPITDDSASRGGFNIFADGYYNARTLTEDLYANFRFSPKASLLVGTQYIAQNTDQDYFSISPFGIYDPPKLDSDSANARNGSLYASFLLTDVDGFNLEAGGRYNNHSIYGSNATYSFNPSYNIDDATKVFLNISSGYKIPSLYQLHSEYGNKALNPEKSHNYELGVQAWGNGKRNWFRVLGFKRDIKNLIVFYTEPAPSYRSYYINRDEQHDYGFEVESSIGLGTRGNWVNNLTYVDGEGENDGVKIKNLFRRPNLTFNSVLTLQPVERWTVMPSFRFVGTRAKGLYDYGPAQMPQYYTLDFYTAYDFKPNVRAFVDLRNITDQQYFDVPGYNSRRFNWMAGVSVTL